LFFQRKSLTLVHYFVFMFFITGSVAQVSNTLERKSSEESVAQTTTAATSSSSMLLVCCDCFFKMEKCQL